MSIIPTLWVDLTYLTAAVFFIVGIKLLSSPETAAKGNFLSAFAMFVAVGITLLTGGITDFTNIIIGASAGALVGFVASRLVKMTAMPQMVALYNGLGGAASALVAISEYLRADHLSPFLLVVILISLFIGALTLTGSLVAFAKLQELVSGQAITFPLQNLINLLLVFTAIGLGVMTGLEGDINYFYGVLGLALLLGILVVIPIGGADMPVVIALLNSYSGIAVSFTGFVLSNNALIIVGSLVGASGLFLTNEMCVAMHRSIWNVLFGGFGASDGDAPAGGPTEIPGGGSVKPYTIEDAVTILENAGSVVLVPGYGMAVAQAQHIVYEITKALRAKKINVRFGIHPVAGRMPGHMNVLLAEARVPYDIVYEMDEINDDFPNIDVSIIIGANDIVNPSAMTDPNSPIAGMPVMECWKGKITVVLKRGMATGYAGVQNPLFFKENTRMLFGDAGKSLDEVFKAI